MAIESGQLLQYSRAYQLYDWVNMKTMDARMRVLWKWKWLLLRTITQ